VLGKVLYVGLRGAFIYEKKHLMIRGQMPELETAFKLFIQNKKLQSHMKNNGWSYTHSTNKRHRFIKD
jgi:hypothetical protein